MRRAERAAFPRTPRTSAVMTKRVIHLEPENSFKQFTVFITAPGGVAEPVIYFILGRQALTNAVCTSDERRKFPKEVLQHRSPQNFLRGRWAEGTAPSLLSIKSRNYCLWGKSALLSRCRSSVFKWSLSRNAVFPSKARQFLFGSMDDTGPFFFSLLFLVCLVSMSGSRKETLDLLRTVPFGITLRLAGQRLRHAKTKLTDRPSLLGNILQEMKLAFPDDRVVFFYPFGWPRDLFL